VGILEIFQLFYIFIHNLIKV